MLLFQAYGGWRRREHGRVQGEGGKGEWVGGKGCPLF